MTKIKDITGHNPILQEFLHYHPLNGKKFVEVDYSKDASDQIERLNEEVDALIEAKSLSLEQCEQVGRVLFSKDVTMMSTAELKRDILVFAKKNPSVFLSALSDPSLKLQSTVQQMFDTKVLSFRNKKRDVHYNLEGNRKRMTTIPFGVDPIEYLADWFKTDEGVDVLEFLEKQM